MTGTGPGLAPAGGAVDPASEAFEVAPCLLLAVEGPDLVVRAANAALRAELGPRTDWVGRPLRDAVPEVSGQQLFERIDAVRTSGTPAVAQEWRLVFDGDGDGVPEEHYLDFVVDQWRRPDGTPRGAVLAGYVATRRVEAARAAREEADRLATRFRAVADVVAELQRALLPERLPVVPELDVAARYLVAEAEHAAGGDWFDAVVLPGGRIALVVGDVVGHGVAASGVMGRLRAVLVERLAGEAHWPDAVAALDLAVQGDPPARGASVCVAVVDQHSGRAEYLTRGHPPPLLVRASGEVEALPGSGAPPLGSGARAGVLPASLERGDALFLYTDGLVERRDRTWQQGFAQLRQVVSDAASGRSFPVAGGEWQAAHLADVAIELQTRLGYRDDVTVLVARRRVHRERPLRIEVPADMSRLAAVRGEVGEWLQAAGASDDDRRALVLAVSEAVVNSVEHAYDTDGPVHGIVRVDGLVEDDGVARVVVADAGGWREPRPDRGQRGRGLAMMGAVLDDLRLDHGPEGTTVSLARRLGRAPVLGAAPPPPGAFDDGGGSLRVQVRPGPEPVVTVVGELDGASKDLDRELRRASRSGAVAVSLDLSGLTHLGSAGVRVLLEASGVAGRGPVRLVAPRDSTAAFVLDLAGIPYDER